MTRMQTLSLAAAAVLAALAAGWIAGRATNDDTPDAAAAPAAERQVLYYRNPMGLPDTSPVPKKDSMGMDYIPVYAGDEPPAEPGTVVLSPEKIQMLGVRTEEVRRAPLPGVVRTSGTVEIDETRQYAIAPRFEGWVERLHANQTGMRVRAGQPLLSVYSPQLAAAQQEYRLADAAARRLAPSDSASAASMARLRDAARARLRNWDVSGARLGRSDGNDRFVLASPADAVVIEKPVVQGARFEAGETILRLADLSHVWVTARVPAAQAADISAGQPARFESSALPGRTFNGEVTFVQPLVDPATRTVDVRIAVPNGDGDLRPGLFGTVQLELPAARPALTVPRSAVLDSGTRQLVFVQGAPGRFAPREVATGRRAGERVEILEGLSGGESVVVGANFLIDAESNLQAALQGMHAGHDAPAAVDGTTKAPAMDDAHRNHAPPSPSTREPAGIPPDPIPAHDPHAGHRASSIEPAARDPEPAGDHAPHEGH